MSNFQNCKYNLTRKCTYNWLPVFKSSHRRCSIKSCFWKSCNIHRKTPVLKSLFNKVAGLKIRNFIKKSLQRRGFIVNISKIFKRPVLRNISKRLLLYILIICTAQPPTITCWKSTIETHVKYVESLFWASKCRLVDENLIKPVFQKGTESTVQVKFDTS